MLVQERAGGGFMRPLNVEIVGNVGEAQARWSSMMPEQGIQQKSFREQAKELMAAAFGDPQVMKAESGNLYRWVMPRRDGLNVHVYVTMDSPEMPDIAHVMVSEPSSSAVTPLTTTVMRTLEEVKALIKRIRTVVDIDGSDGESG